MTSHGKCVKNKISCFLTCNARHGCGAARRFARNALVFVVHADCPDGAEELKKLVEERLPDKSVPIYTAGIGPIIGATVGPGTLAVYCYGKEVTFKNAK